MLEGMNGRNLVTLVSKFLNYTISPILAYPYLGTYPIVGILPQCVNIVTEHKHMYVFAYVREIEFVRIHTNSYSM